MAKGSFTRHLVITIGGNAGALALFALLMYVGTPMAVAVAAIYLIGYVASYLLQRLWNWKSERGWWREALAYLVVYAGFGAVNAVCLWWLKSKDVHPVLAQACMVVLFTPLLHLVLGWVVFRRSRASGAGQEPAKRT